MKTWQEMKEDAFNKRIKKIEAVIVEAMVNGQEYVVVYANMINDDVLNHFKQSAIKYEWDDEEGKNFVIITVPEI